jgi:uncharacterized protein (DUF983 family)
MSTGITHLEKDTADPAERQLRKAIIRGWRLRCPNCGAGPIYKGYLKVRHHCPVCSEALHHHHADDGPAYLTILIVGHLLGPMMLWFFVKYRPDPWSLLAIFSVAAVILSIYLLPRLKGAIIAMQWARRMHGFGAGR